MFCFVFTTSVLFIFMNTIKYMLSLISIASNSSYAVPDICFCSQAKETDTERTQAILVHIQGHHNLLLQES